MIYRRTIVGENYCDEINFSRGSTRSRAVRFRLDRVLEIIDVGIKPRNLFATIVSSSIRLYK